MKFTSLVRRACLLVAVATTPLVAGCGKSDADAKPAAAAKATEQSSDPNKPTTAECELETQHEIDIVKDESVKEQMRGKYLMKHAMQRCMAFSKPQLDCKMKAADVDAWNACKS
jgi:hypothetical protein